MKRFTHIRIIKELPTFPENKFGLKNGSFLTAAVADPESTPGIGQGESIPIFFNGEHVCIQGPRWTLDGLIAEIEAGVWELNHAIPLTGERLEHAFYESESMLTPENLWKALMGSDVIKLGERFMLRHEPALDPEDIRAAATAAGIDFTIHQKLAAATPKSDGDRTTISIPVSAGDSGFLQGGFDLGLDDILTGDAFFVGSVEQVAAPV